MYIKQLSQTCFNRPLNKIISNIRRGSHTSFSLFLRRSSILLELEFVVCAGFCGRRKTGELGDKPLEQGDNQQQTPPMHI